MSNSDHKWNRIKSTLTWSILLIAIGAGLYFSTIRKSATLIKNLQVVIESPNTDRTLITEKEIAQKLMIYLGYEVIHASIKDLDLMDIEKMLQDDKRIKNAEVYLDSRNNLIIRITEKKVISRVQKNELSYYLDVEGKQIPVKKGRAVRVPLVTGHVGEYSFEKIQSETRNNLRDVYELSMNLISDEFLSALIEQIDIDNQGRITMVPKIGREKITLYAEGSEEKLFKLKYMYKDGLPKEGWNKYTTLNLDFENQVVAELRNSN